MAGEVVLPHAAARLTATRFGDWLSDLATSTNEPDSRATSRLWERAGRPQSDHHATARLAQLC
jgi:hypothetical protein